MKKLELTFSLALAIVLPLFIFILSNQNFTLGTIDPDSDQYLQIAYSILKLEYHLLGKFPVFIHGCDFRPIGYPTLISIGMSLTHNSINYGIILIHTFFWVTTCTFLILRFYNSISPLYLSVICIVFFLLLGDYFTLVSTEWAIFCMLSFLFTLVHRNPNWPNLLLYGLVFGAIVSIRAEFLVILFILAIFWISTPRLDSKAVFSHLTICLGLAILPTISTLHKANICIQKDFNPYLALSLYASTLDLDVNKNDFNSLAMKELEETKVQVSFFSKIVEQINLGKTSLDSIAEQMLEISLLKIYQNPFHFITIVSNRIYNLWIYILTPLIVFLLLKKRSRQTYFVYNNLIWASLITIHIILVCFFNIGLARYVEPLFFSYLFTQFAIIPKLYQSNSCSSSK